MGKVHGRGTKVDAGQRQHSAELHLEALGDGQSLRILRCFCPALQPFQEPIAERGQVVASGDWHEFLQADPPAACFDAALVAARTRPCKAGLEHVVGGQRLEAGREHALGPSEDLRNGRLQVVVDDSLGHAAEVGENAYVTPSRKETWSCHSYNHAKSRPECISRITNIQAFLRAPAISTAPRRSRPPRDRPGVISVNYSCRPH